MVQTLKTNELSQLYADFIIPAIAGDMLTGTEKLDDIAEFTMHDIIAGLKPDAALLCIALCCMQISAAQAHLPIAGVMGIEAEQMVDDYAPLWIAHKNALPLSDQDIREQLTHLPEDLEALGDFLKAVRTEFGAEQSTVSRLCDILSLQAEAHAEAAEAELEKIELAAIPRDAMKQGNVVLFPQKQL